MEPDEEAMRIVRGWDSTTHVVLASVSGVHAIMQLMSYYTCNQRDRFKLSIIPVLIATILCLHSVFHVQGWMPVFMGRRQRIFRP
eukprot:scaffold242727_cov44-Prasinocladus_malaysianus.AAC.1